MIQSLSIGTLIATSLLVGWIAFTFARAWTLETGSLWQRTLKAGRQSATIAWAKLVILVGGLVAVLVDGLVVAAGAHQGPSSRAGARTRRR